MPLLVSVIIPNYNHSNYLEERINSVLKQTYKDFEVIILDDNSTDKSLEVIAKYSGEKRISHIVKNTKNTGNPFLQWKKGVDLAKGELIWLAESDDVAAPDFLQQLILGFEEEAVVLSFSNSVIIDEDGKNIDNSRFWGNAYKEGNILSSSGVKEGNELLENHFVYHCVFANASSVVFRKKIFLKCADNIEEYRHCGDWMLWMKMLRNSSFFYLDKDLNYFRTHQENVRTKKQHLLKHEALQIITEASKIFKENVGISHSIKRSYFEWGFKSAQWSSDYSFNRKNLMLYRKNPKIGSFANLCTNLKSYLWKRTLYFFADSRNWITKKDGI